MFYCFKCAADNSQAQKYLDSVQQEMPDSSLWKKLLKKEEVRTDKTDDISFLNVTLPPY
jgi:hypothetical protein